MPELLSVREVLVFKSSTRIDWKKTERNIAKWVYKRRGQNYSAVEMAMEGGGYVRKIRSFVHHHGVHRLYKLWKGD